MVNNEPILINDFLGFNDNEPVKLKDNEASVLANLYIRNHKLARRLGTMPLGPGALAPDRDLDMLQWCKIAGTEYLVGSHNGDLVDFFNAGATITSGTGRLTAGTDANAAWVIGNLYVGDGVLPNVRFNGANAAVAMVPKAPTGTVAADGGAGNLLGTYRYKVAFVNADGVVGEPSDFTGSITFAGPGGRQASLSSIPLCPAGSDCTGRALYRFGGTAATTQFVAAINDNTTTTAVDNVRDADLGAPLLVSNTRMPPCRYLVEWQNRLVGAYCTTAEGDKQTIFISNVRQPYYCPLLPDTTDPNQGTQIPLQDLAEGTITGLHVHGTVLVAFTGGVGYLVQGTSPEDFQLVRFGDHGCVAHRTIVSTHGYLIWLGTDGIYAWIDGERLERISDTLYNTFAGLTAAELATSWAFVYDNRYYLGGSWGAVWLDLGTRFLPAFYRLGVDTSVWNWGSLTGWNWRCTTRSTFTAGAKERPYGALLGHAQAWQMETGTHDNGAPIPIRWSGPDWSMGLTGHQKRVNMIGTTWKTASGIAQISLYRGTGELIQQTDFDVSGQATSGLLLASTVNATAVRQLDQVVEQAEDEFFRMDVQLSTLYPTVELLGVDLHWVPGR